MRKGLIFIAFALVMVLTSSSLFAQADVKPTLALNVQVVSIGPVGTVNTVIFTAKLNYISPSTQPIYIDFYNGSPILTVYPNNYLGSAMVDSTGIAVLKIANHKIGKFAGGAIWAKSPFGPIFAPVVFYSVP